MLEEYVEQLYLPAAGVSVDDRDRADDGASRRHRGRLRHAGRPALDRSGLDEDDGGLGAAGRLDPSDQRPVRADPAARPAAESVRPPRAGPPAELALARR